MSGPTIRYAQVPPIVSTDESTNLNCRQYTDVRIRPEHTERVHFRTFVD